MPCWSPARGGGDGARGSDIARAVGTRGRENLGELGPAKAGALCRARAGTGVASRGIAGNCLAAANGRLETGGCWLLAANGRLDGVP
jgi:hypothetical protein